MSKPEQEQSMLNLADRADQPHAITRNERKRVKHDIPLQSSFGMINVGSVKQNVTFCADVVPFVVTLTVTIRMLFHEQDH